MKIILITSSPFGLQGTPGTYKLTESFSRKAEIFVFAGKPNELKDQIVFFKKKNYPINEVDFRNKNDWMQIIQEIILLRPDVVYFCSGQLWCNNEAEIIKKIKTQLPSTKFVLDVKSPPLINDGYQLNSIRKNFAIHQYLLDKIFSRCIEDAESWFLDLQCSVKIYPLGVPVRDFHPRLNHDIKNRCRRFIYIGAINQHRHIDELLLYVAAFPSKLKNVFSLDIFGSGNFYEQAEAMIEKLNLKENVTLNHSISQKKLFALLPEYDAGLAWVPYEKYDCAPSLKSLEYIAAGLAPLVSDTIAHQRLFENGFKLDFFSHDQKSFENSVAKLCFEGFSASLIGHNLELIKGYDWDSVVDNYIYPELEKLISSSNCYLDGAIYSENIKFTNSHLKDKSCDSPIKKQNIFFLFENEYMITTAIKLFVNNLSNRGFNICIGFPYREKLESFIINKNKHSFLLWDTINVSIDDYLKRIFLFNPIVIIAFYSMGEFSNFFRVLFNTEIPFILSERLMPQRLVLNSSKYMQIKINSAYWQREILLSRASKIHLKHKDYIHFVPYHLRSKTYIFCDNCDNYFNADKKDNTNSTIDFWEKLINETITEKPSPVPSGQLKNINLERFMHSRRMQEKLMKQLKGAG